MCRLDDGTLGVNPTHAAGCGLTGTSDLRSERPKEPVTRTTKNKRPSILNPPQNQKGEHNSSESVVKRSSLLGEQVPFFLQPPRQQCPWFKFTLKPSRAKENAGEEAGPKARQECASRRGLQSLQRGWTRVPETQQTFTRNVLN